MARPFVTPMRDEASFDQCLAALLKGQQLKFKESSHYHCWPCSWQFLRERWTGKEYFGGSISYAQELLIAQCFLER
jgi:hypothetical protein